MNKAKSHNPKAVPLDLSDSPTDAVVGYAGDIKKIDLLYSSVGSAVIVAIEEQISPDVWVERWRSPSTNTQAWYIPAKVTTLQDGTAGFGEAYISLESNYGFRLTRISGAATGTVTAYITFA